MRNRLISGFIWSFVRIAREITPEKRIENITKIYTSDILWQKIILLKRLNTEETGKKIAEGMDFLEDDKLYRLKFHAKGLIQYIRAKKAFKQNKKFRYYTY